MEALEIERQTDQTPLARRRRDPAQGELAEAQHLLDDAEHRFDRAFACAVDRFAQRGSELVGHLDLCARVLGQRVKQRREALPPTGMMGITARGDVGLNVALGTRGPRRGADVPGIQRGCLGRAERGRDGLQRRLSFLTVVGVIGESPSHDQQTPLIHGYLRIVILLEAGVGRVFHDARLRVGKVVLVAVACSWHRWGRWATTRASARGALPLRTLRQLGLILRLLGGCPLGGTRLQHRFGFRQPHQAILAPRNLVAHHQPIGDLWLIALFTQGEQLLDLASQLRLHLQQPLVTDRIMLGGIGMDLGPVQTDRPQLQHARLLGEQQNLHKEVLQLGQEGAPKRGQRIVVGVQVARDKAERHRLIRGALDLTRTEYPGGIAIEQQAQQHFRGVGLSTACPIVGIQRRQVKLGHAVHDEAGQMVRRQTVTQAHCQIQCLVIVHGFKCSFHAYSLPLLTGARPLRLSDKLLGTFGLPGHGKTAFLSSLMQSAQAVHKIVPGSYFRAFDDDTQKKLNEWSAQYRDGQVKMAATPPDERPRPLLVMSKNFPVSHQNILVAYDLAGEALERARSQPEYVRALSKVNTIWCVVSLDDLINQNKTGYSLDGLFNIYRNAMAELHIPIKGKKILVVYTKADLLLGVKPGLEPLPHEVVEYLATDPYDQLPEKRGSELPAFDEDAYFAKMTEISDILLEYTIDFVDGGGAFVDMIRTAGMQDYFTANSAYSGALGSENTLGVAVHSVRVFDALIWAIKLNSPLLSGSPQKRR